ncbi:MAG: glycosyltransferase family 2 protein [Anaerolineaceae bacterium]|nr:glycosyltransferase family 2 protein [Anaerolineaceae bacterium]
MLNPPLISLIMPLYNHERYVHAALQSIINQDYPRLEIIVMDDISFTGTAVDAEDIFQPGGNHFA